MVYCCKFVLKDLHTMTAQFALGGISLHGEGVCVCVVAVTAKVNVDQISNLCRAAKGSYKDNILSQSPLLFLAMLLL